MTYPAMYFSTPQQRRSSVMSSALADGSRCSGWSLYILSQSILSHGMASLIACKYRRCNQRGSKSKCVSFVGRGGPYGSRAAQAYGKRATFSDLRKAIGRVEKTGGGGTRGRSERADAEERWLGSCVRGCDGRNRCAVSERAGARRLRRGK